MLGNALSRWSSAFKKLEGEVITVAPKSFLDARYQRPTQPLKAKQHSAVQSFCFGLREEMQATTATMMLAAISASSRTMSDGIPMPSRAISPSNSAVATAAINSRITSTDRFTAVTMVLSHQMSLR